MLQVLWHIALAVSVASETMQLSIAGDGASVEVPGCNQPQLGPTGENVRNH